MSHLQTPREKEKKIEAHEIEKKQNKTKQICT